jgi:hypothetical protein
LVAASSTFFYWSLDWSLTFYIVVFVPHRPEEPVLGLFSQAGTGLKEPVLGHCSPRLAPA